MIFVYSLDLFATPLNQARHDSQILLQSYQSAKKLFSKKNAADFQSEFMKSFPDLTSVDQEFFLTTSSKLKVSDFNQINTLRQTHMASDTSDEIILTNPNSPATKVSLSLTDTHTLLIRYQSQELKLDLTQPFLFKETYEQIERLLNSSPQASLLDFLMSKMIPSANAIILPAIAFVVLLATTTGFIIHYNAKALKSDACKTVIKLNQELDDLLSQCRSGIGQFTDAKIFDLTKPYHSLIKSFDQSSITISNGTISLPDKCEEYGKVRIKGNPLTASCPKSNLLCNKQMKLNNCLHLMRASNTTNNTNKPIPHTTHPQENSSIQGATTREP